MSALSLRFVPVDERLPGSPPARFDEPLLDDFVDFLAGRSRPNSVLAATYDLKVFFTVVPKPPVHVTTSDVLAFIEARRAPRRRARAARGRRVGAAGVPGRGGAGRDRPLELLDADARRDREDRRAARLHRRREFLAHRFHQ